MASSMLNGDRRWGQTRKSGMTVLGKVPKPINLPSQRLENHGLDPNVEIVPKGTLTWGSRPPSTAPNAWGSSSVSSPNTDGSSASTSSFSGRPSSGGSFTRPSTSASDRSHQGVSSAWGPNSRPSSASGILPSNQTSAAVTRPRSAETRPGTLQLSSFAEPNAECSPWGTTRIAEKLVHASKSSNFTLSSGDFPTLGSEKNSKSNLMQQDYDSQGRPASALSRDTAEKKITEPTTTGNQTIVHSLDKGDLNTWRRDNPLYIGITIPPSDSNWHRDQQQMLSYPHSNVPSHQFDSWNGPPMQSPADGIWYRGGPPGGLMRPDGPTGSYPIDPYVYYPHLPARPLSNSQAGPRHGAPMGGFGPMGGAPYHPRAPDPYMVPNISVSSVKPEVSHQVHYGHTPSFGNGNDKDGSDLGISPCPNLGNQHLNQNSNVDSGNFYAVPCYYGPSTACEPVEDARMYENQGSQYKVLLKQHGACKDNDPGEKMNQSVRNSVAQLEIKDHSGPSRPAQSKGGKEEPTNMGFDGVISHRAKGSDEQLSVPTQKNVDITTKSETVDDHCANSATPDSQRYLVKKSSALIEKIETLNNKARLADGRCAVPAHVEEKKREIKNANIKADSIEVVNTITALPEKSFEKVSSDGDMQNKTNKGDSKLASTVDVKVQLRTPEMHTLSVDLLDPSDVEVHSKIDKSVHVMQNKADYHTKSQFNSQDGEEWQKKSPGRGSTIIDNTGNCPQVQHCQPCEGASEKTELHHLKVGDEPYIVSLMDPVDYRVQHAKMKEIARQRAKQLQEEEEERIREQKARALAKLEELNRRTSAEISNQTPPSSGSQSEQDAGTCLDSKVKTVARALNSGSTNAAVQKNESVIMYEESIDSSTKAVSLSVTDNDPSMSLKQDVIKREAKTDSQSHDKCLPKQKQMFHKKQDNCLEEKHMLEKNLCVGVLVGSIIVGSKSLTESVPPSTSSAGSLPSNNKDMDEPSMQHRKSNNRTTRNKNKLDEPSSSTTLQLAHKVLEDVMTEGCKANSSESVFQDTPFLSETSNGAVASDNSSNLNTVSSNEGSTQGTTGGPGKASVQWKAQPPRRVPRYPQTTKAADKFHGTEAVFWAPVKSTTKKESSEEVQRDPNQVSESSGKNGNEKYKRAEMERYVPKPIAKEISQQAHQSASSIISVELGSQGISGSGGLDHSVTQEVGVLADTKIWDGSKPAKHGRTHTSWRRRGPPESSPLPGLLEGVSSDSSKDTPKNSCLQQPSKHDDSQQQAKFSDDGWNDDKNYLMQSESSTVPLVEKYHLKMNRGRRQPLKGHKVVGNNSSSIDNWDPGHGRTDKSVSEIITIEADESDGTKSVRNGNHSDSDHPKSRWQPKSQASSRSNHFQGMGGSGEQKVASRGNRFDKESPVPGGGKHNQTVEGKSVSTAGTAAVEIRNVRQNEERRERRAGEDSSVRRSLTEIHDSTLPGLVPQNVESQNEPVSSGTCRHGQHSGWFPRGHETSFGGSYGAGQDTGKHYLPANVDRCKQYQTARCYDKYNDSIQHKSAADGAAQGSSQTVGKYRERGHNNPRRVGYFSGRNRSSEAYGSGE